MRKTHATTSKMATTYDIKGKVVLVTGANRGIGKALVEGFLAHGATKVYAAVRTVSSAEELVQIHGKDRVVPVYMDLSKPETIREAALHLTPDVQVVVNNAGVLELAEPLSLTSKSDADDDKDNNNTFLSALQHQMEVNVYGFVHVAQQYAPLLEQNGGGALIQINSVASLRCPDSRFTAYSASKAASYSIIQGIRASMKHTFVMSVHPGPIATDMVDKFNFRSQAEAPSQVVESILEGMKKGDFLVYTDSRSRQIGKFYQEFATRVIEPGKAYTNK